MVHLRTREGQSRRQAARTLGFSVAWVRKWWRRYRAGGAGALHAPRPPAPGALAAFPPAVAEAVRAYRRAHPRLGARRAHVALQQDPTLAGLPLPGWRTIHRAWVHAGLVRPRRAASPPPTAPPVPLDEPHAVWQIDHQDGLHLQGVDEPVVLQSVRAPAAGLTIGADIFAERRGAHAVSDDAILDALRRHFGQWGLPRAIQVDGGVRFLGQSQRTFPSRFELFCAGLGIQVQQIRPGRPTDNGAVERLHRTLDGVLLETPYADLAAAQAALDAHVDLLNAHFPSRAKACHGQPPLRRYPHARHSGRPYDPAHEAEVFDLAAVDRVLAQWQWQRQAAPSTGQISFANKNVRVGDAYKGQTVALRFDPTDRQVVIYALGTTPGTLGQEMRRFHCAAFEQDAILGTSTLVVTRAAQNAGGIAA
jgi:transposase InsO family protein